MRHRLGALEVLRARLSISPAVAFLAAVLIVGCTSNARDDRQGDFLVEPGRSVFGLGDIPSGTWFTYMGVFVENGSDVPVRIRSAELVGQGIGSTLVVHQTDLGFRNDDGSLGGIAPGGFYRSRPPALPLGGGRCAVQSLTAVRSAVLQPGASALVAFVLEAAEAGSVRASGVEVTYAVDDDNYSQFLPIALRAEVAEGGTMNGLPPGGRACASRIADGTVEILPGWPTRN